MKKSIPYQFPKIYNLFLRAVDKGLTEQKYQYLAKIIGKNKTVFELGCGTALLADYLHPTCNYSGWDLNENFVNYCRSKGLKVSKKIFLILKIIQRTM